MIPDPGKHFTQRAVQRLTSQQRLLRAAYMGDPHALDALRPYEADTRTGARFSRGLANEFHAMTSPATYVQAAEAFAQHPLRAAKQTVGGTVQLASDALHGRPTAWSDHPLSLALLATGAGKATLAGRGAARMSTLQGVRQAQRDLNAEVSLFHMRHDPGPPNTHSMHVDRLPFPDALPAAPPAVQQFLQAVTAYQSRSAHSGTALGRADREHLASALQGFQHGYLQNGDPGLGYTFNTPHNIDQWHAPLGAWNQLQETVRTPFGDRVDPQTLRNILRNRAETIWNPAAPPGWFDTYKRR